MKAQDRKIFLRNAELSTEARFLWCLIETWADPDGTNAHPKLETLALSSGRSLRWIKKYLRELKKKGFVKISKRRGAGSFPHNVYSLFVRVQNVPIHAGTIRTLYQVPITSTDTLSVESEAILRELPPPRKSTG